MMQTQATEHHSGGLKGLVEVVDRLLGPGGCPWDQEQTHETLKKHLIEEAYEVLEAIDSGDASKLREELGDLLLQPIMHAQMEKLAGNWDIEIVAHEIAEKLVRRHPHVFHDTEVADADEVLRNWDAIKKAEKGGQEATSILAGIPKALPALARAHATSVRAARAGFEWPDLDGVFAKLDEEVAELRAAISGGDAGEMESELGDLLFTVVNIGRWLKLDSEDALRKMVSRFSDRFMAMEAATSIPLAQLSTEEWDELWQAAKKRVPDQG